jgi:protein-S-isoprenylcysteine O-methyltransferase Ste14
MTLMAATSAGMWIAPIVYLATDWLSFADYPAPVAVNAAGVPIYLASIWLLWRSHADLGRQWSPTLAIRSGHQLVTEGVYSRIRHPMYASHWLWAVAQAMLLSNWIAGPAFLVCFLPLYLTRVPEEERLMLDSFGDEYRQYMARTGRLVPRSRLPAS